MTFLTVSTPQIRLDLNPESSIRIAGFDYAYYEQRMGTHLRAVRPPSADRERRRCGERESRPDRGRCPDR